MQIFLGFSFYWQYYLMGIILLPGLLLGIYAQNKVTRTYAKYSKVSSEKGMTASEVARLLLSQAGCNDHIVTKISGNLTDNYNSKTKTVSLSNTTYDSTSVAAIGVATHEIGHVLQHKTNYFPLKLRKVAIACSNISSQLLWPLVVLGAILSFVSFTSIGSIALWSGIAVFGLSVLVNLVTLPVEYNASKRATQILEQSGILTIAETNQAKEVLNAAALTYVASLVISLLSLLRFILAVKSSD